MGQAIKIAFAAVIIYYWPLPTSAQCGFAIAPAADVRWYHEGGWEIPGLTDAKSMGKLNVTINGTPHIWPEGITVSLISHEENYQVSFPEAVFDENGIQKKMLARHFLLSQMLRWEINGTPYAYSYFLLPNDIACSASIDIIDDRGDGKFRVMTPAGHPIMNQYPLPPPIPKWSGRPQS